MYCGEKFGEATETVADYLEDIRNEDVARVELPLKPSEAKSETNDESESKVDSDTEQDEPKSMRILFAEENVGPNYIIIAREGDRFFRIQAQFELWHELADYMTVEQAEDMMPSEITDDHPVYQYIEEFDDLESDEQLRLIAAFEIILNLNASERRELIIHLSRIFTDAALKHSIDALEPGVGITGFKVYHKIFPYDDEFDIGRLNRTIERVRMAAHMGELFLKYTFNLPVDLAETTGGDVIELGEFPARPTGSQDAIESTFDDQ